MSVLTDDVKSKWLYGSTLPFAEPAWARGCPSPYYRDSHRRLRQAMRSWVEKVFPYPRVGTISSDEHDSYQGQNLIPNVQDWEKAASIPGWIYKKAADDGLLMPIAAGPKILADWKGKYPIIGSIPAEEWDGFHDLIVHDEIGRTGGIG